MADTAIRVENLSKQYRIGGPQVRYKTIRESLTQTVQSPFRRLSAVVRGQSAVGSGETIWALKDVSFEVKHGEVVGIIGRNGAGKTTLLKILSRITEPTEGRVRLRGRVGSLLEVGTGFHPELTGRENIYLNGAILGMKRAEMARKFDEIVAFAEIEKFLDTPVKHYSSGMYVRLAFSVAAHLEPETLLVDEVLAVGDADFQKRCLGKIGSVANEGRTVVFVSHNMASVLSLCSRGLLFERGGIRSEGPIGSVVRDYVQTPTALQAGSAPGHPEHGSNGRAHISFIEINGARASEISIQTGDCLDIRIGYESQGRKPIRRLRVLLGIYDQLDIPLYRLDSDTAGGFAGPFLSHGVVQCKTGPIRLTPGPCYINVAIKIGGDIADHIVRAVALNVEATDMFSGGVMFERREALYLLEQNWEAGGSR